MLLLVSCSRASATGGDISASGDDLDVRVNWKWAGNITGGYYPIRIQVKNSGVTRELTFQFGDRAQDEEVPVVRRTVICEQDKTTSLLLLIPIAGNELNGTLFVKEGGERIAGLDVPMQLPNIDRMGNTISALVISRVGVDTQLFRETLQSLPGEASDDVETVSPDMLPNSWLAYTGLDLVTIEFSTFRELSEPVRAAVIQWVQSGGNLILYNVKREMWDDYDRLLSLTTRQAVHPRDVDHSDTRDSSLAEYQLMQGIVLGVSTDPFQTLTGRRATMSLWHLMLNRFGTDRLKWSKRNGFLAREGNRQFTEFLIPGVKSVPVYSFLTLITIFTLIIGPINYIWLWKKRQLNLLLVTVPFLAFVTSVSLFAYSAVQHGFGVKSRIRSLTILDQGTQESVTSARVALFAGMTPSLSLKFSPQTAVFPIWPSDQTYEQGDIDWTDNQSLENGWLRARTRTQFFLVNHSTQRGRLTIKTIKTIKTINDQPQGPRTVVSNGLEWGLEALLLADEDGQMLAAHDVPAGAEAKLHPLKPTDLADFRELIQRFPVEPPERQKHTLPPEILEMGDRRRRYRPRRGRMQIQIPTTSFKTSIMERRIMSIDTIGASNLNPEESIPPRTYVAILKQNPNVDLGFEDTDEQAGLHVLIGYFE
jgi:hypothetical protein